jgi:hypothetical protein
MENKNMVNFKLLVFVYPFFPTEITVQTGVRRLPTKFHHFVPVLLHETHPYYNNRPPTEHSTTVLQQASPA